MPHTRTRDSLHAVVSTNISTERALSACFNLMKHLVTCESKRGKAGQGEVRSVAGSLLCTYMTVEEECGSGGGDKEEEEQESEKKDEKERKV